MAYTLSFIVDEYIVTGDQVSGLTVTVEPTVYTVTVATGPITVGGDALTGSGDPRNVVTSDFKGQLYKDTDTGIVYASFTAGSDSDWTEILVNF